MALPTYGPGQFVDDTMATPKLSEDPLGALTSADWWMTRPSGERISAEQAVVGPLMGALNALTFSGGDELVAAGNAGWEALQGGSFSDTYNKTLNEARGIENNTPIAAKVLTGLPAALKIPVPNIWSTAPGLTSAGENIAKAALLGEGFGATQGFLEGEDGLQNRAINAAKGVIPGAIFGGATQGIFELGAGALKNFVKYGSEIPKEEEALGRAFKLSASNRNFDDQLGALRKFKDEGGIASPSSSETPFSQTVLNLDKTIGETEGKIQSIFAESGGITTKEIFPNKAQIRRAIGSAKDNKAFETTYNSELENLQKIALSKDFPEADPEKLWSQYQSWKSKASAGDKEAKDVVRTIEGWIDGTQWSPNELRNLRIRFDKNASWEAQNATGAADAYRSLRDYMQKTVVNLGGARKDELRGLFNKYEGLMDILGPTSKMKNFESMGKTQGPGVVQNFVGNNLRTLISRYLGIGHLPAVKPAQELSAAFGETIPQRIVNNKFIPDKVFTTAGATGALSEAVGASIFDGFQPKKKGSQQGAISETQGRIGQVLKSQGLPENQTFPLQTYKAGDFIDDISEPETKLPDFKQDISMNDTNNTAKDTVKDQKAPPHAENLYKAVTYQETRNRKDAATAVSPKGAIGLMQIMPKTATEIADDLGIEDYDLKDPETNKLFGRYYLNKMYKRFGDTKLALAAYNAGPTLVARILEKTGFKTFEEIERYLPKETREYVPSIMRQMDLTEV